MASLRRNRDNAAMNSAAGPPADPPDDSPENQPPVHVPAAVAPARSVSKLPLYIMTAVVVLAILLVLLLAALRGNTEYEAGSPEEALQTFLVAALEQNDYDTVNSMLTAGAKARCRSELSDARSSVISGSDYRAELEDMDAATTTATAIVRFHRSSDDPFDGGGYSFDRDFLLVRSGDDWLIDEAEWPRALQYCSERAG